MEKVPKNFLVIVGVGLYSSDLQRCEIYNNLNYTEDLAKRHNMNDLYPDAHIYFSKDTISGNNNHTLYLYSVIISSWSSIL